MRIRSFATVGACAAMAFGVAACGGDDSSNSSGGGDAPKLSGTVRIDGSSTVYPFAQAAAELFKQEQDGVTVNVGQAGTGGGFEKFCAGETDISDASRSIEDDEKEACDKEKVAYDELQVANDGIAVVTNKALAVKCLTTDQLKDVWDKGSNVKNLADVDPSLPAGELSLFGPGTDSGTFDYFTEEINGEEGQTREDYQASENDNQLIQGVEGSQGGLGYFGYSYYEGAKDKLNLVSVDAGDGCVTPSSQTIQDGSYKPLSRPIFMYPSDKAIKRPEVKAFMDFVFKNQQKIAEAAKIVPMTSQQAQASQQKLTALEQGGGSTR